MSHNLYAGKRKHGFKLDYVYMVQGHRHIAYGTQLELERIFGEVDAMAHMKEKWSRGNINKQNLLKYLKKAGLAASTGVMDVPEDNDINGIQW